MTDISQDDLLAILADELDAARAQLEALGVALIEDSKVATRHIARLQAIDHVGQRCASIAAILRSDDLQAASVSATLETIPARLEALLDHMRQQDHAIEDTASPRPPACSPPRTVRP